MPLTEKIFNVSYKGFSLKVAAFVQERSSEYLLCLHGLQANKELFKPLLEQEFVAKYSFIAIDCIGFGNSSKPEDFSYDIEEQAHIVNEVINQLAIKKLHIIGHSLGGVIGTLLLQPLESKILSFINIEGNLTLNDSGISKIVAEYSFEDFKNDKYMQIQNDLKQSREPSAFQRNKWIAQIPDYVFYQTSVSLVDWAKSGKLLQLFAQSSSKKVYMIGDKNRVKRAIVPTGIQTIVIPNAGHFMLLDNPKVCFAVIKTFLQK